MRSGRSPTQAVCAVSPSQSSDQVRAEMILMVVEAHAGRWASTSIDRDQQLELRFDCAGCSLHASGATEERIVGDIDFDGQAHFSHQFGAAFHPVLTEKP